MSFVSLGLPVQLGWARAGVAARAQTARGIRMRLAVFVFRCMIPPADWKALLGTGL
jgi:hypothetical protein